MCSSDTVTLSVAPTAITKTVDVIAQSVEIFPNPATDQVSVRYTLPVGAEVNVSVMNTLGQRVAGQNFGRQAAGTQQQMVPLNGLGKGLYLVNVLVDGQPTTTKKLIIQ